MKHLLFLLLLGSLGYALPGYGQCNLETTAVFPEEQSLAPEATAQVLLSEGTEPEVTYVLCKDGQHTDQEQTGKANEALSWEVDEPGRYTVVAQQGGCEQAMEGQCVVANAAEPDEPGGPGGCSELYPIQRPDASSVSRCGSGSVTLRATSPYTTNASLRWYDDDGKFLTTGPTYKTPSLNRTTNYEVRTERRADNGDFCESAGTFIQAVIDGPPTNAGPDVTAFTGGSPVDLSGASPAGGNWSVSPSSAAGALNGNTFAVANLSAGTYTLTYTTEARGVCPASDTRTITVNTLENNYNYVAQDIFRTNGATPSTMSSLPVASRSRSITYLDGLGRPMQEVQWKGNPSQQDLVQAVEYDELGRQAKQYLPYTSGSSGEYKKNNGTAAFYNNPPAGVTGDGKPYAVMNYEASPLSRTLSTTGPGAAWHNAGKRVNYQYQVNTGGQVYALSIGTGPSDIPVKDGTYGAGDLAMNETTDEDGRRARSYTNKSGEVVLKQVQQEGGWLSTYYVYDDYGNLRYVLPPKAVAKIGSTFSGTAYQDILKTLAFRYVYDERQRMILKYTPGTTGATEMLYDNRNRLVLSQNALQKKSSQWSFIKYDKLNRPIMTGVYTGSASQSSIDAKGFAETGNSSTVGYTLTNSFPSVTAADVRTVTYYDDYAFTSYTYSGSKINRPTGQVTGSRTKIIGSNIWLTTVTYYDDRYRVVHTMGENHKGGSDKMTNTYDFVGNLLTSTRVHSNSALTLTETYRYDHLDRLLAVTHRTNGGEAVTVAEYEYNALGEMIEKNLHQRGSDPFAQSVDYRYNIRGWLQSINSSDLKSSTGTNPDANQPADLFGLELLYHQNPVSLPSK